MPNVIRSHAKSWLCLSLLMAFFGASVYLSGCQGETPVPPKVKALIQQLQSPQASRRWQAARDLGQLGATAGGAASALVKALDDPHWLVRGAAARALPRLKDAAIKPLHKALQTRQYSYRRDGQRAIAHVVRDVQTQLLPAMIARAKQQPGSARSWSLSAITLLGKDALPVFARLLRESDNDLRASVARIYPSLGVYAGAGLATLATHLRDREASVRQQVLRSLVAIGTKDPKIHARTQALFFLPGDVRVKIEAAKALASWGVRAPKVVDGVLEILSSPTALKFFHFQLLEPLGVLTRQLGSAHPTQSRRAIDVLIRFLQHRMAALRVKAAQALARIGSSARLAAPTLLSLLAKEPHLRPIVLRALRAMLDVSMLQQLIAHKAPTYRVLAAQCLTTHAANPKALPLLLKLSRDTSGDVRKAAIQTIAVMLRSAKAPSVTKQRLLARLLSMARSEPKDKVRAAALQAYFQLQPKGATAPPAKRGAAAPQARRQVAQPRAASRPTSRRAASRPAPTTRPAPPQPRARTTPAPGSSAPGATPLEALLWQSFSGPKEVIVVAAAALATWQKPSGAIWQAWEQALLQAKDADVTAALWRAYSDQRARPGKLSEALRKALFAHEKHHAPKVRAAACLALGRYAATGATPLQARALLQLLSVVRVDAETKVAQAAARGVGALAQEQKGAANRNHLNAKLARKIAQGLLAQKAHALRLRGLALVAALPTQQQRPLVPRLLKVAQRDPHGPCREEAAELLVAHTDQVDVALWGELLYDNDAALRLHALRALGQTKSSIAKAIPGLIAIVWGREVKTESRAIALLGRHNVKAATQAILDRITAKAWSTRAHAIQALAPWRKGSDAIQKALQRATHDLHPKVRQAAKQALAR